VGLLGLLAPLGLLPGTDEGLNLNGNGLTREEHREAFAGLAVS